MRLRRRTLVLVAAGITLALGLILAAGAGWLLKTQSGRNFVSARITTLLKNKLHGRSVYLGHWSGSLFGSPTIDSIEIRDADDSILVATGRITAQYDLVDLWDARVVLQRLTIEHPYVHLRHDSAGKWNFSKLTGPGGPARLPSTGRHLGDVFIVDSLVIHDGVFRWSEPWTPPSSLRGAALDSAIAHTLARTDADIKRTGNRFVHARTWRKIELNVPHARLHTPDSAGVAIVIAKLGADEFEPPFVFHDARGKVVIARDTVHIDLDAFKLPGSAGNAHGVLLTKNGFGVAIRVVADTVSMADIAWINSILPKEGGGRVTLDIRKPLKSDLMDFALTNMDVSTTRSRLVGAMTFGVGAPMLSVSNVDLDLAPVDFKLFEAFAGKPMALPFAGQLTGHVAGPGGPLDQFVVDTMAIAYADANVPGVVNRFHGHGGLNIVDPAVAAFHNFSLGVDQFDLRTARALDTTFAPLKGRVSGTATLDSVWTDLRFHDADLSYLVDSAATSRFSGGGRVTIGEKELTYDLSLVADPISLDALARSYPTLPVRGAFSGPFTVRGTMADLAVGADWTGPSGRLQADLRLDELAPSYRVSGTLKLIDVDPARLFVNADAWQGKLTATVDANVRGDSLANLDGALRVEMSNSELGGTRIYAAHTALTFADGIARTDSLVLRSPIGDFRGSGGLGLRAGRSDSLVVAIQMDSLGGLRRWIAPVTDSAAVDSLAGAIAGTARLTGSVDSLDARVELHATELAYGATTARQVNLTAQIADLLKHRVGTIALVADTAVAAGVKLSRADLDARMTGGDTARVALHLLSTTGPVIDAGANVAWDSTSVRADVDSLQLMIGARQWRLARAARFMASADAIMLDTLDLRGGGTTRLVLAAALPNSGPVTGTFRTDSVPLADIGQLLQVPLPLGGDAALLVQLGGTRDAPTLDFRMSAQNALVGETRVEGLQGSGTYANRRIDAQLDYRRNGVSVLNGVAKLPIDLTLRPVPHRLLTTPLEGKLTADTTDLSVIEAFTSALTKSTGKLDVHLTLGGTWEKPQLLGNVGIVNGASTLARLGKTRYDNVHVAVRFFGDSITIDTLSAHSGAGSGSVARASGWLQVADLKDPKFNVTLTANNFEAINKDGVAKLTVSTVAPVQLRGTQSRSTMTGGVRLNGDIYIPEVAKKDVLSLNDPQYYRLIDTTSLATQRLLPPLRSAIVEHLVISGATVLAGDDLWLKSGEAHVKLSGELKITRGYNLARGLPQLALDGVLTAEQGNYRLSAGPLQKNFDVEGGTVRFFDDIDFNPTIDISAINTVGTYDPRDARPNIRVRVNIVGTLSSLKANFSSPDAAGLSQTDLLSYLITGAPSFDIGGRNSDYFSTVTRVGISSLGAVLSSRWAGGFFDTFDVTTASVQGGYGGNTKAVGSGILSATRLGAGKQFGPFFVHADAGLCSISQGSFDPVEFANTVGLKVDYRFTGGLSLSAGLDPSTAASLCSQNTSSRGFVPTPRQGGFDLFKVWRY